MSRPRKPDFWDDRETTPKDVARGAVNRLKVLKELIQHALSTEPLDASLVAKWHKDCFSGLSYVGVNDECFLGACRGENHPRLKNMRVRVGDIEGAAPHEVPEAVASFFAQLQKRMSNLAGKIKFDQDKSQQELLQIAEVAGWAHGEWVRIHPFAKAVGAPPGSSRTGRCPVFGYVQWWVFVQDRNTPMDRQPSLQCGATTARSRNSSWTCSKARRVRAERALYGQHLRSSDPQDPHPSGPTLAVG